jgi:hypothetical protein
MRLGAQACVRLAASRVGRFRRKSPSHYRVQGGGGVATNAALKGPVSSEEVGVWERGQNCTGLLRKGNDRPKKTASYALGEIIYPHVEGVFVLVGVH